MTDKNAEKVITGEEAESSDEANNQEVLPDDALIVFPNPEKGTRFRLGEKEYMPMSSSRILMSGMPGSGKRNVILNLIHRMSPKPSIVHLVHCDPSTIEYDCLPEIGIPLLIYQPSDFPTANNIDNPEIEQDDESVSESDDEDGSPREPKKPLQNPLVIIDEVTSDQLGRLGQHRFERMVNHVATHKNTTVICSIQSLLNIPAKCRRAFNHIVLWKQADNMVNQMAAQRAGVPTETLDDLFGLCTEPHDFIWVDLDTHRDSPWRYRLDFLYPISIQQDDIPISSRIYSPRSNVNKFILPDGER